MTATVTIVLLGFFLGLRHALDADHVTAVGTIVSRGNSVRRAAAIGALWGIGHSVTILVVGGAIVLFRLSLPASASAMMEFIVALMLITLGILNLRRQSHHHHDPTLRPVAVGVIHGLAGSAAVALLIVPVIGSQILATIYLAIFGVGTIVGMMLMTCALATPIVYVQRRFGGHRTLATCFGMASIGFGLVLGYQIVVA